MRGYSVVLLMALVCLSLLPCCNLSNEQLWETPGPLLFIELWFFINVVMLSYLSLHRVGSYRFSQCWKLTASHCTELLFCWAVQWSQRYRRCNSNSSCQLLLQYNKIFRISLVGWVRYIWAGPSVTPSERDSRPIRAQSLPSQPIRAQPGPRGSSCVPARLSAAQSLSGRSRPWTSRLVTPPSSA